MMLQFNPKTRFSPEKVLKMGYFDDIRVLALEKDAPFKIYVNTDDITESMTESEMRAHLRSLFKK